MSEPFAAVFRLGAIECSREDFEARLQLPLQRFKVQRSGDRHFAQLDAPRLDTWASLLAFSADAGPRILALLLDGTIGSATVDLAFGFEPELVTRSIKIPWNVALLMGSYRIDIEVSTYPVDDEDD